MKIKQMKMNMRPKILTKQLKFNVSEEMHQEMKKHCKKEKKKMSSWVRSLIQENMKTTR